MSFTISTLIAQQCGLDGKLLKGAVSGLYDYSGRFTHYSLSDLFNQTLYRPLWEALIQPLYN